MISPQVRQPGQPTASLPPMTVAGRGGPGGPLDDLVIQRGRWAQRPGELVLSSDSGFGVPLGTQSYLTVKAQETSGIAPIVPFVVAFGIIGLIMSALIVINVVSGAVVAGYRRIGILKSIGFTPAQVVGSYAGLIAVPAVAGCCHLCGPGG
jgi:hypothetical protein